MEELDIIDNLLNSLLVLFKNTVVLPSPNPPESRREEEATIATKMDLQPPQVLELRNSGLERKPNLSQISLA